jgi:hypothetical protein
MPGAVTLAELPPEMAEQVMKRIRIRLRPPLPPELSWESDSDEHDGPPTESADVEFRTRGLGEVVWPVDRQLAPQLVCEVADEPDREGDQ